MKISRIDINKLFSKKNICWQLNPQVNVLVGENGSGKSTILSVIYCMLNDIPNSSKSMIFDRSDIYFNKIEAPITRINDFSARPVNVDKLMSSIAMQVEEKLGEQLTKGFELHLSKDISKKKQNLVSDFTKSDVQKKIIDDIQQQIIFGIQDLIKKDIQNIEGQDTLIVKKTKQTFNKNKDFFNKLKVTMISTLTLSANSIFEFKGSNEEIINILDLEIDKVINDFNKATTTQLTNLLVDVINSFLKSINKKVEYKDYQFIYFDNLIDKQLVFSDLSSGERQLIYMLLQVALNRTSKNKSSIILMDEPEISLHLDWQENFIKQLTILHPDAQFIIVTHSPALVMNGWNNIYVDMQDIENDN